MTDHDVRSKQRFENFRNALAQLAEAHRLSEHRALSPLENQGLIKSFEFTYELAWNTLKDYLVFQGIPDLIGSRDTTREAFKLQLITDGQGWMMMLTDRNRSAHTYNKTTADDIVKHLHDRYMHLFLQLSTTLEARLRHEP